MSSVANVINLIIEHWPVSLIALAVFASVCLGLFKGVKHAVRALFAVTLLTAVFVCGLVIYYFASNDTEGLIRFCIAWLPTIVFLIIVFLSTLIGVHRGLRKSLILLLHAVITAGICIGAFFFCVTSPAVDKLLLDFINVFMGTGGLQSQLGVSADCETMREVLLELINGFDLGEFGILLQSNSAYVLTLINMAYRIVFALLLFIVYQLLTFIMYIIYLFFYSERKYRRKKNIRFALQQTDASYHRHPVGGGCVGLVRGLVSGIISLSFAGSIFFVAAGGAGASKLPEDVSFGDNYNPIVDIYRSIEDYGEQGIFKILNAISDPEDTPYYLFAADIVFSGGLDDSEHGVSGNIKFREELAAYTGFAKNTLALLLKYDYDGEIATILRGDGGSKDEVMDKVINVCLNPEFHMEFDNLIDNFNSQTYVINFALSLADSVVANIDDMSFMGYVSADNKELLQLLFKRGYLCDAIPDERDRKLSASGEITSEIPPYLTINHLFTKKDAQIILDIVLAILGEEVNVSEAPLTVARVLIPYVEDLSIFNTERSREMDPVLARLYCYFDNKYLTEEGEDGITYAEVKNESVYWTKEIRALMSVADGLFTMYDNVQGGENIFTTFTALFDEASPDYAENVKTYEELTAVVSDSALISKVLCSKKISGYLYGEFKKIDEDIYFPDKITYENRYDKDGNLISHGEAYHLLRGLRLLAAKDNKDIIDSLLDESASFEDLLKKFAATITADDPNAPGNSLASYLTESVLLRSALSSAITERAGEMLVVPALSYETDANNQTVKLINKPELRAILDALPELADLIIPLATGEVSAADINKILESAAFNSLLDNGNKIVEGTVSKALIDVIANNDKVIISRKLENYEEWITVGTPGELRKFLDAIDILKLDVEELMNGGGLDGADVFDKLKKSDFDSIEKLLSSEVFYYSASKMMDDGEFVFEDFEVIVPESSCTILVDDKLDRVVKKDELVSVFTKLKDFGLTSEMSNENIVRKLVEQKEAISKSNIISASVVNFIVNNEDISSALKIPQTYIDAGQKPELQSYDFTNPWKKELPDMIGAVDEIFNVSNMSENDTFVFNGDAVSEKVNGLFKTLNDKSVSCSETTMTRLDVIYKSDIAVGVITDTVKDTFAEHGLVYHEGANRADMAILKRQEIDALVALLGNGELDNFDVGTLSVALVRQQLEPDSAGNPKSYLILANFTKTLLKNSSLYVPSGVYANRLINVEEAARFCDALVALQGEKSFDDWAVEDYMRLPDQASRKVILDSQIMCATFSYHVFIHENNTDMIFARSSVDTENYRITQSGEEGSRLAVINTVQLEALFDIIENCADGDSLEIPSFSSIEDIIRLREHINLLYNFDVTRHRMSGVIMEGSEYESFVYTEDCYEVTVAGSEVVISPSEVKTLTREGLNTIIGLQP